MSKLFPYFAIWTLAPASATEVRLPVTRDTWVSAVGAERSGNNGASPRIKLKGIQEFTLLDADCTPLRGKTVVRATLHLHLAGEESLGRVTVSSITSPWEEGAGTNYQAVPGAACFNLPGATPDITGVICGQGGSWWGWGDASPPDAGGWQHIPLDPRVVQARAENRSHGFCVIDDVGNEYARDGDAIRWRLFPNRFFHSRDQNPAVAPYFTVVVDDRAPEPWPAPPSRDPTPLSREVPLPAILDDPGTTSFSLAGVGVSDLFGADVSTVTSARNETTWLTLRGDALPPPTAAAEGTRCRVFPIGAHGDALGTPDGSAPETTNAWLIEVHVPRGAKPGPVPLRIAVGAQRAELPLRVLAVTLPDRLSFVPQMNAYGLPVNERDYYRLAHEHRTCLNCLRYSWKGEVADGCAPNVTENGAWDWNAWDTRFGPLLDGSAFADLPRSGVPVDSFYLPLNENWPMDHERHFKGGYWVETAYDEAYWAEFRLATAAFAGHVAERGWREPLFEFYLNNKVYFKADRGRWSACSAPWIFDEPVNSQDFWALRRFGREFLTGVGERRSAVRMVFRCDISRPEWQRDWLDGVCGEEVVSGALRPYRDRILQRQARHGQRVLMYGSPNPIGTPNLQAAAWCLDAWCLGADGVVPWQTIGTSESWTKPDPTCLFYPTADSSPPVPSLRLKAFTAGQQLVEYLTLWQRAGGHSRTDVAAMTRRALGLDGQLHQSTEDDAGTLDYAAVSPQRLAEFRTRVGLALAALPAATTAAAIQVPRSPAYDPADLHDPVVQKLPRP